MYYGMTVDAELDQAGHKPSKGERKSQAARESVIDRFLSDEDSPKQRGFADPAAMFN